MDRRRKNMRVLVVSADPAERLRATSAMDDTFDIVEVDGVDAARSAVESPDAHFDALVVDGDLQPRGGYAFLYELRGQAELSGQRAIPAVVLASRPSDRWLAGWAGASELFLKPVDPFEVAATVRALEGAEVPAYGDAGSAAAQVGTALRRSGR
jgi:DNA-binding response OmpR family regulator